MGKFTNYLNGKKTYIVGGLVTALGAVMFFKLASNSVHSDPAFYIAGTVVLNGLAILTGRHAFTKIERQMTGDRPRR